MFIVGIVIIAPRNREIHDSRVQSRGPTQSSARRLSQHMSSTIPLRPRKQFCNGYCSNKHTHDPDRNSVRVLEPRPSSPLLQVPQVPRSRRAWSLGSKNRRGTVVRARSFTIVLDPAIPFAWSCCIYSTMVKDRALTTVTLCWEGSTGSPLAKMGLTRAFFTRYTIAIKIRSEEPVAD
jgi:hypothetical protein